MRIECPSCFAAYVVPDSLVTAGRVVRCARCGEDWTAVAPAAAPVVPEALPPVPPQPPPEPSPMTDDAVEPVVAVPVVATTRPSAMERLRAHAEWPQPTTRLRLAWVASLVVLALAAGAAYLWRGQIVAEWPPSARAYALFGLQSQTEPPR